MFELMSVSSFLLAQAEGAPPDGLQGILIMSAPMVLIAVFFYVIVIRPQKQDQDKRMAMLSAIKKHDEVLTIGGIYGTVVNISPDGKQITLKVDDNARLRFDRSAITRVVSVSGSEAKAATASG